MKSLRVIAVITLFAVPAYAGPCGDANNDGSVNVSDATYIYNYVFLGGCEPNPMESGDCNCDGMCNVSDAVMIINHVFVGGGEPCDTDNDGIPDC
ncbi:MAG: hypothetical protein GWN61_10920 [candidate division Zixibacteria bacterium]|nr:hypothetical protein [candidate division Zixibacteria bacterium]NIR64711.1 hypothetical protein [candidate division Zixibacteria bacterium]NIS17040.1 hypothetical protein [candidate division Zixibacteria bacterium]NIS46548.1 hypothetical protein [candidate division Zixibacteria bacterium]NIU14668.1 hypothetical protein [candidate division Zixibacteria bacterium]